MRPHFAVVAGTEARGIFPPPNDFFAVDRPGKVRVLHKSSGAAAKMAAVVSPEAGLGDPDEAGEGDYETPPQHGLPPGVTVGQGRTESQNMGLRYEGLVHGLLSNLWGPQAWLGPWVEFEDRGQKRLCQPDAIVFDPPRIVLIEIKKTHSLRAWWQLRHLYAPVLQAHVPNTPIRVVEVCHHFDAQLAFPEPITLLSKWSDLKGLEPDAFFVLPWKPGT